MQPKAKRPVLTATQKADATDVVVSSENTQEPAKEADEPYTNDEGVIVHHPEGVKVVCMVKNVWTSKGKLLFRQKALIHKDDADLLEKSEQVMKI